MPPALSHRVRPTLSIDVADLTHAQQTQLSELVNDALHRVLHPEDEEVILGWTRSAFTAALSRLERDNGRVQADVIREALKHGGYVTRERVYRIGRYPKDRMLRGFTRPTNRIAESMRRSGEIAADAVDILSTSFQDGVQADGFQVDAALARFLD